MNRIAWVAVLVGGIVDVVATNALMIPLVVIALLSFSHTSTAAPTAASTAGLLHSSPGLTVTSYLIGMLCSILGGVVAGLLAKHDRLLNGALSAWLCVGLELVTLAITPKVILAQPLWLTLLLMPLSPLLGLLGGWFAERLRGRSVVPA